MAARAVVEPAVVAEARGLRVLQRERVARRARRRAVRRAARLELSLRIALIDVVVVDNSCTAAAGRHRGSGRGRGARTRTASGCCSCGGGSGSGGQVLVCGVLGARRLEAVEAAQSVARAVARWTRARLVRSTSLYSVQAKEILYSVHSTLDTKYCIEKINRISLSREGRESRGRETILYSVYRCTVKYCTCKLHTRKDGGFAVGTAEALCEQTFLWTNGHFILWRVFHLNT